KCTTCLRREARGEIGIKRQSRWQLRGIVIANCNVCATAREGSNSVFLTASPESRQVDAERPGGIVESFAGRKHASDVKFLEFCQRHLVADTDDVRFGGQVERKVFDTDEFRPAKNDGSLDDISKLANVARPGVMLKQLQRIVGKAAKCARAFK